MGIFPQKIVLQSCKTQSSTMSGIVPLLLLEMIDYEFRIQHHSVGNTQSSPSPSQMALRGLVWLRLNKLMMSVKLCCCFHLITLWFTPEIERKWGHFNSLIHSHMLVLDSVKRQHMVWLNSTNHSMARLRVLTWVLSNTKPTAKETWRQRGVSLMMYWHHLIGE